MKQQIILNSRPENQVRLDSVEFFYSKFYGFVIEKTKGFIIRSEYSAGKFCCVCAADELTNHNGWPESLKGTVENLLLKNHQVFVFDDYKEFYKWLAE